MHCIPLASSQCFMHLDVYLIIGNYVLIGLDWVSTHDAIFFARHMLMHISCIRTLSFLSICNLSWLCSIFLLSLSLSRINYTWNPNNTNLLRLEILFVVLGLPLLLFPLLTFNFVMRRPKRTSQRTSSDAAFIWNIKSFYRTFPTLLSPTSFRLGVGLLFVKVLYNVSSWLYRSFTPIYVASILLCLCLLCLFEVDIS